GPVATPRHDEVFLAVALHRERLIILGRDRIDIGKPVAVEITGRGDPILTRQLSTGQRTSKPVTAGIIGVIDLEESLATGSEVARRQPHLIIAVAVAARITVP